MPPRGSTCPCSAALPYSSAVQSSPRSQSRSTSSRNTASKPDSTRVTTPTTPTPPLHQLHCTTSNRDAILSLQRGQYIKYPFPNLSVTVFAQSNFFCQVVSYIYVNFVITNHGEGPAKSQENATRPP